MDKLRVAGLGCDVLIVRACALRMHGASAIGMAKARTDAAQP